MNSLKMKEKFEDYLTFKSDFYFAEESSLNEAIKYSLQAPGKRIRPLLVIGLSEAFGGRKDFAFACGMAVEMIHTYSLIHDDLPAMDNDDFRRGRPTNHKVYGDALAILAGDSLLNFAPQFLMQELSELNIHPQKILRLTQKMLACSGHMGMVKGQAMDMKFEHHDLSSFEKKDLGTILRNIHQLKTGSLITWSCLAGLQTIEDESVIQKNYCQIESLGQRIGLLFQMVDDILDVTSTLKDLGKTPGKDEKSGKLSYTNLHGLEQTKSEARELIQDIEMDLEKLECPILKEIVASLSSKISIS